MTEPGRAKESRPAPVPESRRAETVSTPISAVLDACVLFPAAVRDTLLRAAQKRLYRAYFTEEILEEVRRNLLKKGKIVDPAHAEQLMFQIRRAFPASMVEDYAALIPSMTNHPKDRHVLAAAVAVRARVVTFNLADFPEHAAAPHRVVVQTPDDFLIGLHTADSRTMIAVLQEQSEALRCPPMTVHEILDKLSRQQVPKFAELMRRHF